MLVRIFATKREDKIVEGLKLGLIVTFAADVY
jgi:hypothetical protein